MAALRLSIAWYVALLLWMSGAQHLANPYYFLGTVLDYNLVSVDVGVTIAALLPWMQLLIAAMVVSLSAQTKLPFAFVFLLGCVFVFAQSSVIFRGMTVDCGCFGTEGKNVGVVSLLIAGSIIVAGGVGLMIPSDSRKESGPRK